MANGHTPRIGYNNLLESDDVDSIVASNEAAGFEKENAYDWLPYDQWKPGATGSQTLDLALTSSANPSYFAVYAHNLGSEGASIVLQRGSGSPVSWANAMTTVTPSDDTCIFEVVSTTASTDWRVLITNCTTDTVIGVLAFGVVLELQEGMRAGFRPPTFARAPKVYNNRSQAGTLLGRSLQRQGLRFTIGTNGLAPAWMRSDYDPFIEHAQTKPFFFSWDDDNYSGEAVFVWTIQDVGQVTYATEDWMSFSFECEGNHDS